MSSVHINALATVTVILLAAVLVALADLLVSCVRRGWLTPSDAIPRQAA
jgi:hypothetical protein